MNTELTIFLLAAELTCAWTTGSANAQTPPSSPTAGARPKQRPVRPSHMPCRIAERLGTSPRIESVYTLHYRRDGQLDKATQQIVSNRCLTLKACRYLPTETTVLQYEYDAQGRLTSATQPETGESLTVTYRMGLPQEYEHTSHPNDAGSFESRTVITIDSTGRPAASLARAQGRQRMRTTARFSGIQESFVSEPVVWPYAPDVLYLGWARRTATTSIMGMRDSAYETETVTFDQEGRILKEVWTCSALVDTYQAALSVFRCRDSYSVGLL